MPVCCWQVGRLCGILYLSGLLASEVAYVKLIFHIFLHCWQVKQPMLNLSAMHVSCWQVGSLCGILYLSALLASEAA
jgi:hypothetical protein